MADCVFCKIAAGEIPAQTVQATEHVVAFRDIRPVAPTHVLLIPKRHVASVAELGAEDGPALLELLQLAARIARDEGLRNGWRLVTNVGRDAGQSVDHLHFHLIGGRAMTWPPG